MRHAWQVHCQQKSLGFQVSVPYPKLILRSCNACTGEEHHGRKEEAAQALSSAQTALAAARGELAHLQAAAAAAEASSPDWEGRLAAARAELDAAQAASEGHRVRSQSHPCSKLLQDWQG